MWYCHMPMFQCVCRTHPFTDVPVESLDDIHICLAVSYGHLSFFDTGSCLYVAAAPLDLV
jgi:hypothetical protein